MVFWDERSALASSCMPAGAYLTTPLLACFVCIYGSGEERPLADRESIILAAQTQHLDTQIDRDFISSEDMDLMKEDVIRLFKNAPFAKSSSRAFNEAGALGEYVRGLRGG